MGKNFINIIWYIRILIKYKGKLFEMSILSNICYDRLSS